MVAQGGRLGRGVSPGFPRGAAGGAGREAGLRAVRGREGSTAPVDERTQSIIQMHILPTQQCRADDRHSLNTQTWAWYGLRAACRGRCIAFFVGVYRNSDRGLAGCCQVTPWTTQRIPPGRSGTPQRRVTPPDLADILD